MKWSRESGMQQMLADIGDEVKYTRDLIGKEALSDRVMSAMAAVPRDEFVPADIKTLAFDNRPLPIGHGQTISQPYIVALMTDLLAPEANHVVLEIGTGSGYQTAVLSRLCRTVYSMDLVPALVDSAAARLSRLGCSNVHVRSGNGYAGWPENAPYDGIIVTAAASHIPEALVEQLRPGGRLVIPVGLPHASQELMLVSKQGDGRTQVREVIGVVFVPLLDIQGVHKE